MADGDIPGKFVQIGLKVPPEFADRLDVFLAGRNRSQFIRELLEAAMRGDGPAMVVPVERPVSRPKPVAGPGLVSQVFAGREVVDAKDRQRVLDCLGERARSGRDGAKALGLDVGTVGLVMADLVRDGVVRQRRDKVMELVG